MTCERAQLPGVGVAIFCVKGQTTGLLCDGCDAKLPKTEAVSPEEGLDFCPRCFAGAWSHFTALQDRVQFERAPKNKRRADFRRWAREFPDIFMKFVKLTPAAQKARKR